MDTLHRRRAFLRVAGALTALPSTALTQPAELAASGPAADCTVSVATLQQGRPVDSPESHRCRATSGSPAIFQAASLAKPIVATLALKLVSRGKLDLERPLSDIMPEGYLHRQNLFALRASPIVDFVSSDILRRLTVRMLLSHTSGLPNWSSQAPLSLAFEPGTRWRYSGEAYVLLQRILERLTGLSLQALASAELFEPLGMRDSALKLTERVEGALVPGRSASGQIRLLRFPYEIAAGSLYTTATDYVRFIAATLDDQKLLRLITAAPVPVAGAPGVFWGLGWGIEQSPGHRALWHWGSNPGYRALAMVDLASRNGAVVLAASESGMPQAKDTVRRVLPGPHPGLDFEMVQ
jgi:CubicO group peptidase (beta-lactamase class C family)